MERLTTFIFFLTYIFSTVYSFQKNSTNEFGNSYFGIFISPSNFMNRGRKIAIFWNHFEYHQGDKVALYTEKPRDNLEPVFIYEIVSPTGIVSTNVEADFISSKELNFTKQCLKYHVAWLRSEQIIEENCLKIEPTWMEDMKRLLGEQPMSDIFVPGTHNSAAYQTTSSILKDFFYNKYIITQDEDILGQLIYGARYLDIRVCYRPNQKIQWWGCHELFMTPLQTIVNDVKTFLNNTNEIVIFDVHEFSAEFDKDPTAHDNLVNFLKNQLKKYAVPYIGWHRTLNQVWSVKKKLIIGYNSILPLIKNRILWPSVTQQWGNFQYVKDLYKYLSKIERESPSLRRSIPRSAMAQMTPTFSYILYHPFGSIKDMAELVNPKVTGWYNEKWHNSANIVSVDFIKYSGIVDIAIKHNSKRFKNRGKLSKTDPYPYFPKNPVVIVN